MNSRSATYLEQSTFFKSKVLEFLAPVVLGIAWLLPGTTYSAFLACTSALLFVAVTRKATVSYGALLAGGMLGQLVALHWVWSSYKEFTGLNGEETGILFSAFLFFTALQFVLAVFCAKNLPLFIRRSNVAMAFGWFAVEALYPRVFPWMLGHLLFTVTPVAQLAKWGGVPLISFVVMWSTELFFVVLFDGVYRRRAGIMLPSLVAVVMLLFEVAPDMQSASSNQIPILVVQSGLEASAARNPIKFAQSLRQYPAVTQRMLQSKTQDASDPELVVWPNAAILIVVEKRLLGQNVFFANSPGIMFRPPTALIGGGLMKDETGGLHPSAILVSSGGTIHDVYNKRQLMPFGEFVPAANIFPFLKNLFPLQSEVRGATSAAPLILPRENESSLASAHIGALVSYEDMIPELTRESVVEGANVLVSVCNDTWLSSEIALRQHNLVASFRAIENNRYLIRATHSGYSTITSPGGKSVDQIIIGQQGSMRMSVPLESELTLFSRVGTALNLYLAGSFFAVISLLNAISQRMFRRKIAQA